MRKIIASALICVGVVSAHAKPADATIDGATLNISLEEVKQRLGTPEVVSLTEPNACNDDAHDIELQYSGLLVTLSKDPKGGHSVTSIDVTSADRSLSGIRIGDPMKKVTDAFGPSEVINNVLAYDFGERGDGQAYLFTIKDGVVSEIKLNSQLC